MIRTKSKYNRKVVDKILHNYSKGMTISGSCEEEGVEPATFALWRRKDLDGLQEKYKEATNLNMDGLSRMLEKIDAEPLSEDEKKYPQALKLRDQRKNRIMFELQKRHRHVYGDKITHDVEFKVDLKPAIEAIEARRRERLKNESIRHERAIESHGEEKED